MHDHRILTKKTFKEISDKVDTEYANVILENVNDHCLRIAVMRGEYRWHYHNNTDELFVVLEGQLKIEINGNEAVLLNPGEYIKIPSRIIHKTSASGRSVNLCFEKNAEDTIFVD
jgi:mannose-6-phosphate isomerase-like protein (cupin superfamily)